MSFKDFCKPIPKEDLNYVFGRRVLDYLEYDLQKEYANCPKCNLFFLPEEGAPVEYFRVENGEEL